MNSVDKENKYYSFLSAKNPSKLILLICLFFIFVYTFYITFESPPGNHVVFILLVITQLFFAFQSIMYIYTVWDLSQHAIKDDNFQEEVDVFITVCGEPIDVVEETLNAALKMTYPKFSVHILNDGFVANKDNSKEIELLAQKYNVDCITRQKPGGAKAGNINNALSQTYAPFVAIFDADHVPSSKFLQKTMGYFANPNVGFVQTPQFYKNDSQNLITEAAWDQQALFFGAICRGKGRLNSAFMCGTNMVIRRTALEQVGGMNEKSIAEDFLTSILIHSNGWKSVYVPEVLAKGLAPEDFLSYYKQQYRWARGSLDVIFRYNPLLRSGLSIPQRLQYLSSSSYYLTGFIVLIDILLPLIYFYAGLVPITITTMQLALIFFPYVFLNVYILQITSGFSYTFKALSFSLSSFTLQIKAAFYAFLNINAKFSVTSKTRLEGNFLNYTFFHIVYICAVAIGIVVAWLREGDSASLFNNSAWAMLFVIAFFHFIYAAMPKTDVKEKTET